MGVDRGGDSSRHGSSLLRLEALSGLRGRHCALAFAVALLEHLLLLRDAVN
jgi:hypothetical protein